MRGLKEKCGQMEDSPKFKACAEKLLSTNENKKNLEKSNQEVHQANIETSKKLNREISNKNIPHYNREVKKMFQRSGATSEQIKKEQEMFKKIRKYDESSKPSDLNSND
jgi:hypothetical protein